MPSFHYHICRLQLFNAPIVPPWFQFMLPSSTPDSSARPPRPLGRHLSVPSEGTVRPVPLNRDFRLAAALCPKLAGCPDCPDAQHKGQCHKESLPALPLSPRRVGTFLLVVRITCPRYKLKLFRSLGKYREPGPSPPVK